MIAQIDPNTQTARYFDIRKLTPRECLRLMGVPERYIDRMMQTKSDIENENLGNKGVESANGRDMSDNQKTVWQQQRGELFPSDNERGNGRNSGVRVAKSHDQIISNSALYKLAGNSIVCDVLMYIFRNVFYYEDPGTQAGDTFSLFPLPKWEYDRFLLPSETATVPSHFGKTVNVITLCSGYDSQCIALDMLCEWSQQKAANDNRFAPFDYDLVAWAEFDPESKTPMDYQPAVKAHNLNFPQWKDRNLGDMTKIDWEGWKSQHDCEIDLLTYSTPCTDISQAGKRQGIAKGSGTRSAILWYTEECIRVTRPKFLLQENVFALVNQENMPHFREWLNTVARHGYRNYWAVLNARDYGVAQNRARVFCLSVRNDICPDAPYSFPKPFPLTRTIADSLEAEVASSFFLKPESVTAFLTKNTDHPHIYHTTDHKLTKWEIAELIWRGNE